MKHPDLVYSNNLQRISMNQECREITNPVTSDNAYTNQLDPTVYCDQAVDSDVEYRYTTVGR